MADPLSPFVSVIIPVYNDAARLTLCLAALAEQTYPRSRFEIIVIDNGSDEPLAVKAAVEPYDNVILAYEATPGSYAARNLGISLARGEAIAFTDADCIPAADWLDQGVQELQNCPKCGQVVGKIEVFFAHPDRPTSVELYEQITAFPQERLLQQMHGGATANLFTWRQVIAVVGNFNADLKSNGDLEWGQRVYAYGYQQRYAASVLVQHPARSTWSELCARTRRLVGGEHHLRLGKAQSFWQRQTVFVQALLFHLMPPVFFTVNAFLDKRLTGIGQKLKVSGVMVVVRCISAYETVRLKLGGAPSRA